MSASAYSLALPLSGTSVAFGATVRSCKEESPRMTTRHIGVRHDGGSTANAVPGGNDGNMYKSRQERAAERIERRLREDQLAAKPIGFNEDGRPIYRRQHVGYLTRNSISGGQRPGQRVLELGTSVCGVHERGGRRGEYERRRKPPMQQPII
ncbi:hypothetical protein KFL_000550225 [Klebsormidium nitens]|uniref:Uncharacterized protein n=1 Tax=Klebsormidium nitens TaxID=105231 RepID=A0A1Y1HRQ8_KLENI|nr:hypothetical protein KFL_000550225 [Klebsormidium nitens]|eukprot:GAQ80492.1 hypothetical protein KFL_000550225 [Klebsormidium nitens]